MTPANSALWLSRPGGKFEVRSAVYTPPGANEVVVRVRSVAVNFVDAMPAIAYRVVLPWLKFPAVLGSDVAGDVVEIGPGVTRLRVGDRVVGHAAGAEKSRNTASEGAFQHHVVLMEHMASVIPDSLSFEQASVLPLALSTAACGLFQQDQLGLALPTVGAADRSETVLIWGGATSVGINAIQLARNAGYRVVTAASPRGFDFLKSLGAAEVVDRTSPTVAGDLLSVIGDNPLAGVLAIGAGSLRPSIEISRRTNGTKRVSSAHPSPATNLRARLARRHGVRVSTIWGGTLKDNEVGPAIYADFLSTALASGAYRAAPDATIVGVGLATIPDALKQLRGGISLTKLVVTV